MNTINHPCPTYKQGNQLGVCTLSKSKMIVIVQQHVITEQHVVARSWVDVKHKLLHISCVSIQTK